MSPTKGTNGAESCFVYAPFHFFLALLPGNGATHRVGKAGFTFRSANQRQDSPREAYISRSPAPLEGWKVVAYCEAAVRRTTCRMRPGQDINGGT